MAGLPGPAEDPGYAGSQEFRELLVKFDAAPPAVARISSRSNLRLTSTAQEQRADEVQKAVFCTSSSNQRSYAAQTAPPAALASQMFRQICDALSSKNARTYRLLQSQLSFLFPHMHSTPRELVIFNALLRQPLTVTNADLASIIDLELSTPQSPPSKPGHHFYIRSWTFTRDQLSLLLDQMTRDEKTFAETDEWAKIVRLTAGPAAPSIMTIRYIGSVEGPRRPIDRWFEDMQARKNGIFYEFTNYVSQIFPAIMEASQVHTITMASINFIAQIDADDMERSIIAIFHQPTLLNRQSGGYFASYVPSLEDATHFELLDSDFYYGFRNTADAFTSDAMRDLIIGHFEGIQAWANGNPHLSGMTEELEYTDALRQMQTLQATPRTVYGYPIVVFIGNDIPWEAFRSSKPFLDEGSRAGSLVRDFLRRLCKAEATTRKRQWLDRTFDPAFYCFVNLFSTPRHRNIEFHVLRLQEYLSYVRPLITVSYSKTVNEWVRADFKGPTGVPTNHFMKLIGRPTIQHLDSKEALAPGTDDAFINVPHLDPGRDKHLSAQSELRRVLDLSFQATFAVMQVALFYVNELHNRGQTGSNSPSRLDMCREILKRFNHIRNASDSRQLFDNLETAKEHLRVLAAGRITGYKALTLLPSEHTYPLLNGPGIALITAYPQAQGLPESQERRQQLQEIWDGDWPDLHIAISHEETHRKEWEEAFSTIPADHWYLLDALVQVGDAKYLADLLHDHLPQSHSNTTALKDLAVIKQATRAANIWIQRKIRPLLAGSMEALESQARKHTVRTSQMEGLDVTFDRKTLCRLNWKKNDGIVSEVDLQSRVAMMRDVLDKRTLSFTEHGIDVLDAMGFPLRVSTTSGLMSATIPRSIFHASKYGPVIEEMWMEVRTHLGHDVLPDPADEDEVEWDQQKGRPITVGGPYAPLDVLQERDPEPQDGNYLLKAYLDSRFPDGGTWRTASRTRVPDSTEDTAGFVLFLKRPEWRKHPYSKHWISVLEGQHASRCLAFELPLLRRVRTEKISKLQKSIGKVVKETIYHLESPPVRDKGGPVPGDEGSPLFPQEALEKHGRKVFKSGISGGESSTKKKEASTLRLGKRQRAEGNEEEFQDEEDIGTKRSKKSAASARGHRPLASLFDRTESPDDPGEGSSAAAHSASKGKARTGSRATGSLKRRQGDV